MTYRELSPERKEQAKSTYSWLSFFGPIAILDYFGYGIISVLGREDVSSWKEFGEVPLFQSVGQGFHKSIDIILLNGNIENYRFDTDIAMFIICAPLLLLFSFYFAKHLFRFLLGMYSGISVICHDIYNRIANAMTGAIKEESPS